MKKNHIIILIVLIGLVGIYKIIGFAGFFKGYSNASTANEPNLKMNSGIIVSNLVKPKNGDFICYNYTNEIFGGIRVHRLMGVENDTIEIKLGQMFINNNNVDQNLNLIHMYSADSIKYKSLKNDGYINDNMIGVYISPNKYALGLEDKVAKEYSLTDFRIIDSLGIGSEYIYEGFNKNWNKDNFGKLIIPKDKYFVIGDNRDNSEDSRYIGLIDKKDFVGVVIKY